MKDIHKVRLALWPLSLVYACFTGLRNLLFDRGILRTSSFPVPVISLGNITVGGTGKTPHVEYVLSLLKDYRVAMLSRGYRRKSKGFLIAGPGTHPSRVGDEPFQIHRKFPPVTVAVDTRRARGITRLLSHQPDLDAVVLDDAFQHRSVSPGLNILITDFNQPHEKDLHLPAGNLRESWAGAARADIVVISKCPAGLSRDEMKTLGEKTRTRAGQEVFFSRVDYGNPLPVFASSRGNTSLEEIKKNWSSCLLVTGIAHPLPLYKMLLPHFTGVDHLRFPDHYSFTRKDIRKMVNHHMQSGDVPVILTTEKDAVRLMRLEMPRTVKERFFYIPVEIVFLGDGKNQFDKIILDYVGKNQRNRSIHP